MKRFLRVAALTAAMTATMLPMAGCTNPENSKSDSVESSTVDAQTDSNGNGNAQNLSVPALDVAAYTNIQLSNADTNTAWSENDPIITCAGDSVATTAAEGLTIEGQQITITKGGTYVLQGTLNNGQLIVNLTDNTEKVHLICNGISVTSTSAAIWVQQADKVILTLAEGTENSFTDGTDYASDEENADTPNACIYSKDDLTINGEGDLTVNGNCNNGIHTTDDLRIVSGRITVNAVNHGLRGSDSVVIKGGELHINAEGDGIKSTTVDTEGKGFVDIEGGSVTVSAMQDGIDAAVALVVNGGTLDVESGGGTANAPAHSESMGGMHGGWGDWFTDTNTSDTTASTKGIKSGAVLAVMQGTVTINAADDAVHCNGDTAISGGVLTLAAGDDGIHSDDELNIGGSASVTVPESYEGLEAYHISISGGEIRVTASDDGLNAAGGDTAAAADTQSTENPDAQMPNQGMMPPDMDAMPPEQGMTPPDMGGSFGDFGDFSGFGGGGFGGFAAGSGELDITGGYLYVNAGGDGLDSNGNITMTGGVAVICGPTNNGNGPLDSGDNNNQITLTGGTLIAVGATGMMETPESNYIASASLNAAAGTLIVVTDAEGIVLGALQTPKQAQGIVFSANGMSDGYTVYTGGTYEGALNADGWGTGGSYTAGTEICTGSGSIGFSGGMGGFGGGGFDGGRPGGRW